MRWKINVPVFFVLVLIVSLFVDLMVLSAQAKAEPYTINTRYAQFVFQSKADVRDFNSSIGFSEGISTAGIFTSLSDKEVEYELIKKADALFQKVQRILDMRKKMRKVRVNVYTNGTELQKAYVQLFKRQGKLRGWYLFRKNTIYLQVQDVHEGMLAHEFAHAIIDHYLEIRPPRASAEILARFVDEHLHDEVKTY